MTPDAALALALGYLLGSIPFGLLLTRMAGKGDIRDVGSGNIGATNVLRTGNRPLAAATLLLDIAKGAAAVWIAEALWPGTARFAAAGALIGHMFPVWLKFRGGKGVATYLGALIALSHWSAVIFAIVWLGVATVSRWSSAGALTATVVTLVSLYSLNQNVELIAYAVMTLFLWIRHAENIGRLIAGTEPKIGGA